MRPGLASFEKNVILYYLELKSYSIFVLNLKCKRFELFAFNDLKIKMQCNFCVLYIYICCKNELIHQNPVKKETEDNLKRKK